MNKLDNDVKSLLNNSKAWNLSTMGSTPNVVPVLFKKVDDNGDLIIFDVFMNKTADNIIKNKKAAISVYDLQTLQGYQLKGTAQYCNDQSYIEAGNAITQNYNLSTKGAVIIKINEIIVLSPGADNGKILQLL